MNGIPLDLIGAVTGIIGTLTGVISLAWIINNNKPKLRLESAYFKKDSGKDYDFISVKIALRNLSNSSTTVEDVSINTGNLHQTPEFFEMVTIKGRSSRTLDYVLQFKKGELKKYFHGEEIEVGVSIRHTFGLIKKSGKTSFWTGYMTLA